MAKTNRISWDIFCRVVDNFGDIGVCWRLARQLHDEYEIDIRLWVDDLGVAAKLMNGLDTHLDSQIFNGIEVCLWGNDDSFADTAPADVVIEAFACELPQPYIQNMVLKKPVWLNLEYLSAEKWVDNFHAQSSLHPATGLKKTFFFPGFTEKTGGLIREQHLSAKREAFLNDTKAQEIFWQQLDIIPKADALKISLFCYPHAPIDNLLTSMAEGSRAIHCFVPNTTILPVVANHFGKDGLKVGETVSNKQLSVTVLPFLSQADYDKLLWTCDLNFVRGEDSWIRALWSAQPFIWQTYQQDEKLHLKKMNAFLDSYQATKTDILREFHHAWLDTEINPALWNKLLTALPALKQHAILQTQQFKAQADLAAKLVIFTKNQV